MSCPRGPVLRGFERRSKCEARYCEVVDRQEGRFALLTEGLPASRSQHRRGRLANNGSATNVCHSRAPCSGRVARWILAIAVAALAIILLQCSHVRFSNRPIWGQALSDYSPPQYRCRSRARASLRNRHQGPSIMGFEDKVEQSFGRPYRQSDGRVQAAVRTHLIHRPARDIIPPLGGARVSFY